MSDYLRQRQQWNITGKPPKEVKKYVIPKKSAKKIKEEKEQKATGGESALEAYFRFHVKHSTPKCENCGMEATWLLKPEYETIWRACQAHILPKKKFMFPSLAGNLDNHLVLFPSWGGLLCGCHGFFDSSWYNASTMEIWPKAVEIFKAKLLHLIPEKERKNIPEALQKLIEP